MKGIVVGLPLLQAIFAVLTIGIIALFPPADGDVLIVPLTGAAASHLAARALSEGATLGAPGPFPGSIIVHGDGIRLGTRLLPVGVIAVAAAPIGCGAIGGSRAA